MKILRQEQNIFDLFKNEMNISKIIVYSLETADWLTSSEAVWLPLERKTGGRLTIEEIEGPVHLTLWLE